MMDIEKIRAIFDKEARNVIHSYSTREEYVALRDRWEFRGCRFYDCNYLPVERRSDYFEINYFLYKLYGYQNDCYEWILGVKVGSKSREFGIRGGDYQSTILEMADWLIFIHFLYPGQTDSFVRQTLTQLANKIINSSHNLNEGRAKNLLFSCLTEEQKAELSAYSYFTLIGSSKNMYHVYLSKWYNVFRFNGVWVEGKYCAGPIGINLSVYDWVLAQKCMLETDEEAFLKIANKA